MTRRPWRHAILPGLLALIAAAGLWRVFVPADLAVGLGAGAAVGALCGWLLAGRLGSSRRRDVGWSVARAVLAAIAFAGGLALLTGDALAITTVADQLATLLSIGLPADGLADLVVIPYVCTALAVGRLGGGRAVGPAPARRGGGGARAARHVAARRPGRRALAGAGGLLCRPDVLAPGHVAVRLFRARTTRRHVDRDPAQPAVVASGGDGGPGRRAGPRRRWRCPSPARSTSGGSCRPP